LQERLWPFIGGIARSNKMKALKIGGMEDHMHVLISLPSTMPISKAVAIDQGRFVKMDSRKLSRASVILMAERIWRVRCERFAIGRRD